MTLELVVDFLERPPITAGTRRRLHFPYTLNARQSFYGVVESKEAAKRAFAERWRGLT